MAIDLQDLYHPISDFFLTTFGTGIDDVVFRFDQLGSVISEQDFVDDRHPDAGPSAALAQERFSDLVNRVPLDGGDGLHVILGQASIDELYNYRLLLPAVPQVPSRADTFNAIKAEAAKLWSKLTLQSLSGLMLDYKPSLAQPEDWYVAGSTGWTSHRLQITSSSTPAASPPVPVWRLRPSDLQVAEKLELPPDARVPGVALRERMLRLDAPVGRVQPLLRADRLAVLTPVAATVSDTVSDTVTAAPPADGGLHAAVLSDLAELDIRRRLVVDQALAEITPTAPASTSSVTIGFDYCLVRIERPWWFDPFVTDPSWSLPGVTPGSLSAPGTPGGLPWLPIAVAVVRNLVVEAAWSGDDAANLAQATGFGPFRAELDSATGRLEHPGIQVAGWLLQRLPSLPPPLLPADPTPGPTPGPTAGPTPSPTQDYVVQAGDTLSRIAQRLLGDASRWPEIQQLNHLADPNVIHVDEHLTIPATH